MKINDQKTKDQNLCLVLQLSPKSYCIEVSLGDIFMKQKMRFGLVLDRLAILKKGMWADYEQLLRLLFFSYFEGQKNILKKF